MVGRLKEQGELQRALESPESEFVAVYGRRRVGKTFLINETFQGRFAFHAAGLESAPKGLQLESFCDAIRKQGNPKCKRPKTWIEAFSSLETLLESKPEGKKVVFLDELPWFDTHKSNFLAAFEWFWNGWACLRKDIVLVVCGSATTWIVKNVLHSRGGLYNRVTRRIHLEPFTLAECEQYAAYRHLDYTRSQLMECYMALGGVAFYWSLLRGDLSVAQNFDRLFFGASDEMRLEASRVFTSLFKTASRHIEIVKLLAKRKVGMTREEVIAELGKDSNGDISVCLEELSQCGFIRRYNPVNQLKKGAVYQLMDNFILFHDEFLARRQGNDPQYWTKNMNSPRINNWRGRAFERVCLWHVPQIKQRLGILGIEANVHSWRGRGEGPDDPAAQIDMLIDRADGLVDICEIKYSAEPYEMTKEENDKILHRCSAFQKNGHARRSVRTILIASSGLKPGKYSSNIMSVVTGDDLFAEVDMGNP